MKNPEFKNKVTRTFGDVKLKFKKHSPEILVVTGVIGVVGAAVLACRATTKASKIVEQAKEDLETINHCVENPESLPEPYTKEDAKKDTTIVYAKAGLQVAKEYAPAVVLGALSIGAILGGHNILRKRNMALGAAYAVVDTSFKEYRKRVIERFGNELDKEIRYNVKAKEVEETVVDKDGKEKKVTKTVKLADSPAKATPYTFCYDVGCEGWQKDPEHNKWFLLQQQNYANEKLKAQGYLFMNDVLESLGLPKTKAGQIVGWRYRPSDPTIDSYVDFGIFDMSKPENVDFVNGYERSVWITLNVDGPIYDKI